MPVMDIARRFRLEDVSHSAGVFDEDKLSWVNRHYLKTVSPARLATESLPFLRDAGLAVSSVSADGHGWLEAVLPGVATSVDRLNQLPERLHSVFHFAAEAALGDSAMGQELREPEARAVVHALAAILATVGPLTDRESFRAAAAQVKERTGAKGKALFHPIRLALTGAAAGPELDVLVPAIDRAATLPPDAGLRQVTACRQRAAQVAAMLPA